MATLADYTFGVQGILLLANGVYTLLYPKKAVATPSPLVGTPVSVVHAMSMSSLSLGFLFLQIAYQQNRDIMKTAAPMRFVAASVFYYHGGPWRNVAWYEATWGLINIGVIFLKKG